LRGQQKPKLQLTTAEVYASSLVEREYDVQPLANKESNEPVALVDNYSKIIDDLAKG
jgi:hypothetical protein